MNRLDATTRTRVLNCLIEGCSIRSTVRMTGVSKKAVTRLLVEAGTVAAEYQDRVMRDLPCRRIQVDTAHEFISDLASRLRCRVQMTTDGHRP
jgi:hypothetical protein